jgi:hypothetical protein
MVERCLICGTPVSDVTICNYCKIERKERDFFKSVTREEIREARIISQTNKIKPSKV